MEKLEGQLGHADELVVKGKKCDNGFKTGYLLLLENKLANKFPWTDLKGLNSTSFHIDALPEVWEAHLKVDPIARNLKNKKNSFYSDWLEIFGNDHATGNDSQHYSDVVNAKRAKKCGSSCGNDVEGDTPLTNEFSSAEFSSFNICESSLATKDKGKASKRRQIADTMGSIAQQIGSWFEACKKRELVYDQLGKIEFLSVEARVEVSQYLCNNSKDMDLFFSIPEGAEMVLVKRIMKELDFAE
ncbi:hypothetical protein ACS0TY_020112 [Phlomoides rotata]